jgi:DNA-binding NarL/FixJ family response regulator
MIRFLIVDDHAIVRIGLTLLIHTEFPGAEIDECATGGCAWKKINTQKYDLVILDMNMPGNDPVNLLGNISSQHPDVKVLILTMNREDIYAKKYTHPNVKGLLNKGTDSAELLHAITTILDNKRYLSPGMSSLLLSEALTGGSENPFDLLTSRELEVTMHWVEGKSPKDISEILAIQPSTVGAYKSSILQKLGLTNVLELNKLVQSFKVFK